MKRNKQGSPIAIIPANKKTFYGFIILFSRLVEFLNKYKRKKEKNYSRPAPVVLGFFSFSFFQYCMTKD
jgi:hypothetical protein